MCARQRLQKGEAVHVCYVKTQDRAAVRFISARKDLKGEGVLTVSPERVQGSKGVSCGAGRD